MCSRQEGSSLPSPQRPRNVGIQNFSHLHGPAFSARMASAGSAKSHRSHHGVAPWSRHSRKRMSTFMSGRAAASSAASSRPAHLRHDYIGDHEVDGDLDNFWPRPTHRVPFFASRTMYPFKAQKLAGGKPDRELIFRQQHSFATAAVAFHGRESRLEDYGFALGPRQINSKDVFPCPARCKPI